MTRGECTNSKVLGLGIAQDIGLELELELALHHLELNKQLPERLSHSTPIKYEQILKRWNGNDNFRTRFGIWMERWKRGGEKESGCRGLIDCVII